MPVPTAAPTISSAGETAPNDPVPTTVVPSESVSPTPSATSTSPGIPTPTPTEPQPSAALLRTALLTADELPEGFTTFTADAPSQSDVRGCDRMASRPRPTVSARFRISEYGPYLYEGLTALEPDEAVDAIEDWRSVLRECDTYTARYEGLTLTIRVHAGVLSGYGDETVALRFDTTAPGMNPTYLEVVVVRLGGVLLNIGHEAYFGVSTTVTELAVRAAVHKAESRL